MRFSGGGSRREEEVEEGEAVESPQLLPERNRFFLVARAILPVCSSLSGTGNPACVLFSYPIVLTRPLILPRYGMPLASDRIECVWRRDKPDRPMQADGGSAGAGKPLYLLFRARASHDK